MNSENSETQFIPEHTLLSKSRRYLRRLIFLTFFAGIGTFFTGCMGYMASEPTYVEYSRPSSPSNTHIWIDGDWGWNSRSHVYVQKAGHWDRPRQGQTHVSGHWKSTPRGKTWSKGHWQRDRQKGNRGRR